MRRWLFLFASVLSVVALAVPATADVSGGVVYEQRMQFHFSDWTEDGDGVFADFTFVNVHGVDAGVPGPVESTLASGFMSFYDLETGDEGWLSFQWQEVGPTAYISDPLGNHATLEMTLVDQDGETHDLALEVSRPQSTALDVPGNWNPGVNAWYDLATGDASASSNTRFMVNRHAYTVAGAVAGVDVYGDSSTGAWVNTSQGLRLTPTVTVP